MTEQQLRALVRDAIARQAGTAGPGGADPASAGPPLAAVPQDASHQLLAVVAGADGDGACLIEPAVRCTHCGYCQSFGH